MKRGIFLLSALLLSVKASNAQNINLLGTEVSIITAFPVILTLVVVLFFMGLFVKDYFTSKKKEKTEEKTEVKEEKTEKKVEKKIVSEPVKTEKEILRTLVTKIKNLENNIDSLNVKESLSQIDALAKDFFKAKYSIDKEFSLSELDNLVKATKEEMNICNEMEVLKFSGEKEITLEKVTNLISSLSGLIEKLYYGKKEHKELSKGLRFLVKIKEFFSTKLARFRIPKHKEAHVTPIAGEIKEEHKIYAPKILLHIKKLKLLKQLNKGIRISKENMEEAKKIYGKSLIEYYHLPTKEEEKVTNKLAELYSKIKDEKIHSKRKIEDKAKQLIKIKKEGHKRHKEAKRILDSIEKWITEVSIKEVIRNEYRTILSGIRNDIRKAKVSDFEHNFYKIREKIVTSIKNIPPNSKKDIIKFENEEQKKVAGFIKRAREVRGIPEKKLIQPTERELYVFKHRYHLPKELQKAPEIKNERLKKLLIEEDRIMKTMKRMEETRTVEGTYNIN